VTNATPTERPSFSQMVAALEAMDPEQLRATAPKPPDTAELVSRFPELGAVEMRDVAVSGPHGTVPTRLYRRPGDDAGAALVWVHGGGFIGGDLDMPEAHWVSLTSASRGFPVLSVDYRKCLRGVHFPTPSDEVLAAWLWAVQHATELGSSPDRLHLGGASAGGNLVAGVTKRLRDGAGPMPASLILVYPLVHPELPPVSTELAAALARLDQTVFTSDVVRAINRVYAGTDHVLRDP
jgi:acetyl esterase